VHCETLLRLSIEEVNFTSARRTNIALSVLKAKQLQWTTTVCKNCRKGETLAHYDKTSYGEKLGGTVDPPAEWENISGGWHSELGVEPPNSPAIPTLNWKTSSTSLDI